MRDNEVGTDLLREVVDAVAEGMYGQQVDRTLGPAVRRMVVSQSHVLLDQQLGRPGRSAEPMPLTYDASNVEGLTRELDAAIVQAQTVAADQVRTRLLDIVRRQVRTAYEDALERMSEVPLAPPVPGPGTDSTRAAVPTPDGPLPGRLDGTPIPDGQPASPLNRASANGSHLFEAEGGTPSAPGAGDEQQQRAGDESPLPQALDVYAAEASTADADDGDDGPSGSARFSSMVALRREDGAIDEVYEGTVRLNVAPTDGIKQVMHFVDALRQKPEFRLLQLVGTRADGVDIWLSLREPLCLKQALLQMKGVSQVVATPDDDATDQERLVTVRLLGQPA